MTARTSPRGAGPLHLPLPPPPSCPCRRAGGQNQPLSSGGSAPALPHPTLQPRRGLHPAAPRGPELPGRCPSPLARAPGPAAPPAPGAGEQRTPPLPCPARSPARGAAAWAGPPLRGALAPHKGAGDPRGLLPPAPRCVHPPAQPLAAAPQCGARPPAPPRCGMRGAGAGGRGAVPWLRSGCRTGPPGCARSPSCCAAVGGAGCGRRAGAGGGLVPGGFIGTGRR